MLVEETPKTFNSLMTFSEALLDEGKTLKITVTGISMSPFLKEGDLIYIKKFNPERYQIGDVVVFKKDDKYIVHRLISFKTTNSRKYAQTKGDSVLKFDMPVDITEILGKVCLVKRAYRMIDLTTEKAKRKARIIAFLSPFFLFFYWIIRKLKAVIRKLKSI
ncbi:signal peptidase I [Bacteroidota bacterium]